MLDKLLYLICWILIFCGFCCWLLKFMYIVYSVIGIFNNIFIDRIIGYKFMYYLNKLLINLWK